MAAGTARLRTRRAVIGIVAAAVVGAAGVMAAHGDGAVTISPERGEPGAAYTVTVDCGAAPVIYRRNTQDSNVQMTMVPYLPPELSEISPSTWRVTATASTTDDQWVVSCDGVEVGSERFDAESPHLWIGPRPTLFESPYAWRTELEGTDCPDGTEAAVRIDSDSARDVATTVTIDRYGDWRVRLPVPNGDAEMRVAASCGSVTYPDLLLTTTSTEPELTEPTDSISPAPTPSAAPSAPAAAAVAGSASFTG